MPGEAVSLRCRAYIVKPLVYEELEQKLSEAAAEIITTQENDKYQAFGRQWVKKIGQECQKENIPRKDLAEQVKAYIIENLKESCGWRPSPRNFTFPPII